VTISYPLSLPSTGFAPGTGIRARAGAAVSESPFTGEQQVYVHQLEVWSAQLVLPPMSRADAEGWIGFLLSLNGREGTFLFGDPRNTTPTGTWAGSSPLVKGGSQTGKSLSIDGLSAGATIKAGDWLQLGSGNSARLHKVTQDATANGAGEVTLDIWPRLRSSPADNAPLTIASAQGVFRLASNELGWDFQPAQMYDGYSFAAVEAL